MASSYLPARQPQMNSTIPQRRRRQSVEIIDVDAWQGERPTQRRRLSTGIEVIDLVDSDIEEIEQPIASGSSSPRNVPRRRLFSPPAPDPEIEIIPPVPALPSHGPMRRLPPRHPAANPIIAHSEPFDFEDRLTRSRAAPVTRLPAGSNARLPNIQLGGAYVTDYEASERQHRRQRAARRQEVAESGIRRRARPFTAGRGRTHLLALNYDYRIDDLLHFDNNDLTGTLSRLARMHRQFYGLPTGDAVDVDSVHYKPHYTHPEAPEPGFATGFVPTRCDQNPVSVPEASQFNPIIIDDDDRLSKPVAAESCASSLTATLVCARCHDPLVTGITGDAVAERAYKIWALRCGHMIDGKCADALSAPAAKEIAVGLAELGRDGKDRGKAMAELESPAGVEESPKANPIRTRLRSYHPRGALSVGLEKMSNLLRKGKAKAAPAEIYTWTCPVPHCGHVHKSVRSDGEDQWSPDQEGQGIIGIFA